MESPLKARARLARQKAKEGATAKRKRAQKGAQVPPLGARLEKRWTTSTKLGEQLARRTREARKDKHQYLAAIYGIYDQARRANKLEVLWQRAQPAAGSMPATPEEIIAGLIRGTYADKELKRDSVSQWSQAVCGAVLTKCPPAEAYAFFADGGIAKAREVYREHTRNASPPEAAAKPGSGSGRGSGKPGTKAPPVEPERKGRAATSAVPPSSTGAGKAPAAAGRATADRLTREVAARRDEVVRGAESCLLAVCECYRNGELIELKSFEFPLGGKRATRPDKRPAAGRRKGGPGATASAGAGKRRKARAAT